MSKIPPEQKLSYFVLPTLRIVPFALLASLAILASGCGTISSGPKTEASPVAPPSIKILTHLLPKKSSVVKAATIHFQGKPSEEVVVSTTPPKNRTSVSSSLIISTVVWNAARDAWKVNWHSPAMSIQQDLQSGHPAVSAISAWQIHRTPHGALIGLLAPASLGATTLWNSGVFLWVSPSKTPRIVWTASGNHSLPDAILTRTSKGIVASEDACSAVEGVVLGGRPQVKSLSCTNITSQMQGTRIDFSASSRNVIHLAQSTISAAAGTTLVFRPANAATAQDVNNGSLSLYGGYLRNSLPVGQVPLAQVDSIARWSYKLTSPGTYRFAIVPSSSQETTVPPVLTVTVANG